MGQRVHTHEDKCRNQTTRVSVWGGECVWRGEGRCGEVSVWRRGGEEGGEGRREVWGGECVEENREVSVWGGEKGGVGR